MLRQSASYCRQRREAFSNNGSFKKPSKVLCLQKKNVEKEQKNSKSINTINTIIFLAKNFFQIFFRTHRQNKKIFLYLVYSKLLFFNYKNNMLRSTLSMQALGRNFVSASPKGVQIGSKAIQHQHVLELVR